MALPDLTDLFVADSYIGVLHTANIPVSGANLPPVYDGVGNRTSLRIGADKNGATVSGTLSADQLTLTGYATIIDYLYPIGSIYLDSTDNNPQNRFTGTTWGKISEGKFLAGVGNGTDKNGNIKNLKAGDDLEIGEYDHTLITSEIPSHNHNALNFQQSKSQDIDEVGGQTYWYDPAQTTDNTGGDAPHNNIPPYYGIYIWKRLS